MAVVAALPEIVDTETKHTSRQYNFWWSKFFAWRHHFFATMNHWGNFWKKHKLQPEPMCYYHPKLRNLFRKRIKPKKQHEIERIAALCAKTALNCRVNYILDFGSGLGHLSRVLGYGYGLNVCCLEQQTELTEEAKYVRWEAVVNH